MPWRAPPQLALGSSAHSPDPRRLCNRTRVAGYSIPEQQLQLPAQRHEDVSAFSDDDEMLPVVIAPESPERASSIVSSHTLRKRSYSPFEAISWCRPVGFPPHCAWRKVPISPLPLNCGRSVAEATSPVRKIHAQSQPNGSEALDDISSSAEENFDGAKLCVTLIRPRLAPHSAS